MHRDENRGRVRVSQMRISAQGSGRARISYTAARGYGDSERTSEGGVA